MKNKIIGIFVCSLLICATVIPVAGNFKIGSTSSLLAINTSVDKISSYNIHSSPLKITATGPSDLDSVTLYYRWSEDNKSWTGTEQFSIYEDFESGTQNTEIWNTYQTGTNARIQWDYGTSHSGSYSCAMDDNDNTAGNSALNVIYTNIDFSNTKNINIDFWEREWNDESHNAWDSWEGWRNFDVVAFSNDGNTWYEIISEPELNRETFTNYKYNISADPDFESPPTSNFMIAFQQYDNVRLTQDGRAWDDIYFNYTTGANGINWSEWDNFYNPDTSYPWSWDFNFPEGTGYYEFYSIGKKSGEDDETPPVDADAQCLYNRMPEISNEKPSNGSTGIQLIPQLEISISDADGDTMNLNWYSNSSGTWKSFGSNSSVGDGTYFQNNSNFSDYETTYWWYVTANDNIYNVYSSIFHFTTLENLPPNTPSDPDPEDGETDVNINKILSWSCDDPNGDNVTYDVYFGKSSPPPKVVNKQSESTYNPGLLDFDTKYYWRIVAWDTPGLSTSGPIWDFTTEENLPPHTPYNPNPPDGANDVPINHILLWTGGDPNTGDIVEYDVYFGKDSPPPLYAEDITQAAYDPGTMDLGTTYYWQIVSEDSGGLTATGPIWSFITELEPNVAPTAPEIYGPPSGPPGVELFYAFVSDDPDKDQIKYIIEWGDGNSEETDYFPPRRAAEASHIYEEQGDYTITVKAEDDRGLVGRESTFEVTIVRTRNVYQQLLLRLLARYPILERLLLNLLQN